MCVRHPDVVFFLIVWQRAENLWHRATYILVENSKRQLYVQVRTTSKDYCPGYFDCVTGGVVAAGEEYDVSAQRELEEELGIPGVPLTHLFTFPFEDEKSRVWGCGFYCMYDGDVTPQESEVQRVEMMTLDDIDAARESASVKFTPDSLHFLELFKTYVASNGDPAAKSPVYLAAQARATARAEAAAASRMTSGPMSRFLLPALCVGVAAVGLGLWWNSRQSVQRRR